MTSHTHIPKLLRSTTKSIPSLSRGAHDLVLNPRNGRPIIKSGPGGRHSITGHTATVFGCTGFLGRYLVAKLAKQGTTVLVPTRDWDEARHLKVSGDLGVVIPMEWDLRSESTIHECVRHSDIVYNLLGRDYETKNFKFDDVHVSGPRRIARISHEAGVAKFVQLSHLNASPTSPSAYYRTKYEGELAVREEFETATVVRPGAFYGYEDKFLNHMVKRPWAWRSNDGATLVRPVHIIDVATALHRILEIDSSLSSTYSLPGPSAYTYRQILTLLTHHAYPDKPFQSGISLPKPLFLLLAKIWDKIYWPTISPDDVLRKFIDDFGAEYTEEDVAELGEGSDLGVEQGLKSWTELGIKPDRLELTLPVYARNFRPSAYQPIPNTMDVTDKLKKERYQVIE